MPTRAPRPTYVPQGDLMRRAHAEAADVEPPMPVITRENAYQPETDWEKWLMKQIWTNPAAAFPRFAEFVATLPAFDGPADGSDVLPPGAAPVTYPPHFLKTPIHFTPLNDPRYARVYYTSSGKYTFNHVGNLLELLGDIYRGESPRRILDVGTGMGPSAIAFGKLFPEAEVIGVDLAAHFVRFARGIVEREGLANVRLYQQNAAELCFEDSSFDIVHEGYVLHEQPQAVSRQILSEMRRVLRPGGRMTIVDVIYDPTEELRQARVQRSKGPEPFLAEYMKLNVAQTLIDLGFEDVQTRLETGWDGQVWTCRKPA